MSRVLICIFAVSALALARGPGGRGGESGERGPGGRGPHGPPSPPFLRNVTAEGRRAFEAIIRNENSTKAETQAAIASWATTYDVSDAVTAFEAEMKANYEGRKANVTEAISELSAAFSAVSAVIEDTSITRSQEREQIKALLDTYSPELRELLAATRPGPPHGGHGGPGGHGGKGGKGGKGGNGRGFGGH